MPIQLKFKIYYNPMGRENYDPDPGQAYHALAPANPRFDLKKISELLRFIIRGFYYSNKDMGKKCYMIMIHWIFVWPFDGLFDS